MTDIRFAGFGGQGIVLMGIAVARGAAMYDRSRDSEDGHRYATQTQSHGPSARGGYSRSDVKISNSEIHYPFIDKPDVLVLMSEQAYRKYILELTDSGIVIMDGDLIRERPDCKHFLAPATKAAEALGTRIVANIVMLGAFQTITGAVSFEAMERALLDIVPESTHDLNKKALERGRELGRELLKDGGGRLPDERGK
jgi:2-oxoglutarate ferredoxin oxidoreductase subunit gamma